MYILGNVNPSPSLAFREAATVLREDGAPARNETQALLKDFAFAVGECIFRNADTIWIALSVACFFYSSLIYIPIVILCGYLLLCLFVESGIGKGQNKPSEIREQLPPPYQLDPPPFHCPPAYGFV